MGTGKRSVRPDRTRERAPRKRRTAKGRNKAPASRRRPALAVGTAKLGFPLRGPALVDSNDAQLPCIQLNGREECLLLRAILARQPCIFCRPWTYCCRKHWLTESARALRIGVRWPARSQSCIVEPYDMDSSSEPNPAMQTEQLKASSAPWMRMPMLAVLMVTLLAGCATKLSTTSHLVEDPVRLGEIAAVDGPRVRPNRVIEDSRCPPDVQCIVEGGWSSEQP